MHGNAYNIIVVCNRCTLCVLNASKTNDAIVFDASEMSSYACINNAQRKYMQMVKESEIHMCFECDVPFPFTDHSTDVAMVLMLLWRKWIETKTKRTNGK